MSLPDGFKPLLASNASDLDKIQWPKLASAKLDGVRMIFSGGAAFTRNLKQVPNLHVRNKLFELIGSKVQLDGELIVGEPGASNVFHTTQSAISTVEGKPKFQYFIFDDLTKIHEPFNWRLNLARQFVKEKRKNEIQIVPHKLVHDMEELLEFEAQALLQGFEGVMLRSPNGAYKFGRSTEKEGILLKVKRFADSEAEILGFEELMSNQNEATIGNLGQTERSHHKAGMVPGAKLGALLVRDVESGVEFKIGSGFDDATRKQIWLDQKKYLGKVVTYTFQPVGVKEKPRFPVFKGLRPLK